MHSRRIFIRVAVLGIVVIAILLVLVRRSPSGPFSESSSAYTANTTGRPGTSSSNVGEMSTPDTASAPLDTSDWKTYSSGTYSVSYPPDLIQSADLSALTLLVPKAAYFHWPLFDDVKITVTAGRTCPAVEAGGKGAPEQVAFTLNGRPWIRVVSDGAAAGNRYREIAYNTLDPVTASAAGPAGTTCYQVRLWSRGANGAGLYVDDASLIQKYDAVHDADYAYVMDVLNAIVRSFFIIAAPSRL